MGYFDSQRVLPTGPDLDEAVDDLRRADVEAPTPTMTASQLGMILDQVGGRGLITRRLSVGTLGLDQPSHEHELVPAGASPPARDPKGEGDDPRAAQGDGHRRPKAFAGSRPEGPG